MTHMLGLTGSIGMGKSTTAQMFEEEGVPVWDADAVVHKLYARGGSAVEPLRSVYPETIVGGAISRDVLGALVAKNPAVLGTLEKIIHPLVQDDRLEFVRHHVGPLLVFDIPLLFETGADQWLDSVLVVSVDEALQSQRVLERPGMSKEKLNAILRRQLSDTEKRAKADYVIETYSIEETRKQVRELIDEIVGTRDA